jgi:hypothetical protein
LKKQLKRRLQAYGLLRLTGLISALVAAWLAKSDYLLMRTSLLAIMERVSDKGIDVEFETYSVRDMTLGLTNMMFLRPNTLVVEIVGQFDGRMTPICGYHGPLAAAFGVHHYIYYYDWKCNTTLDNVQVVGEAYRFYNALNQQQRIGSV